MRGDLTLPRGRDSHSPAGAGGGINVINNIYIDGKNKSPAPDVANALKLSIPEIEEHWKLSLPVSTGLLTTDNL